MAQIALVLDRLVFGNKKYGKRITPFLLCGRPQLFVRFVLLKIFPGSAGGRLPWLN